MRTTRPSFSDRLADESAATRRPGNAARARRRGRAAALAAGFDSHLSKPVDPQALRRRLDEQ